MFFLIKSHEVNEDEGKGCLDLGDVSAGRELRNGSGSINIEKSHCVF